MLIPSVPYKRETVFYLLVVFPVVAFILLSGGNFDLLRPVSGAEAIEVIGRLEALARP